MKSSSSGERMNGRKLQADCWQSPAELMPRLMQRLGLRERLRETEVIDAWSKIVGDFIAAHSTPVALREEILYVRVLQPVLHYELEQISKARNPAEIKTTLRRLYKAKYLLLKLQHGNGRVVSNSQFQRS